MGNDKGFKTSGCLIFIIGLFIAGSVIYYAIKSALN